MKTILVTGANGQLGSSLRLLSGRFKDFKFLFTDIDTLDICNKEAVLEYAKTHAVKYIVNCAAYTAVDKAEDEEIQCLRINHDAVRNLGEVATTIGACIIHISTDYVFDGTNSVPYVETDYTCPMSAYGRTKQAGELILKAVCQQYAIIRTAWLYSEFGNNFVKTMIRLGEERDELNVVFDQIGTPTYSGDLAVAVLAIIEYSEREKFVPGTYHYSNEGVCSWYDFALKIFEIKGISCEVFPIETKDYPTKATRPHYSVLNKRKIKQTYGLQIPHWEKSLRTMINKLNG
ncbi:dTDP-4-dehydrorhamnose reductase [Parabacteroides sp. PF5-5]|uniref:dTDP-4-dehydrorhamnose reductase n=1 Tax=unclassified Parabacteroides TaxID=2649774 RepID=UPI002474C096|nr:MULTISPECIES: dTDP-4-dehydrorhamnose reductase [unclassified Parabacteroides]MDH6306099.1 dTDP-4-dehydrorhamnose reductase [Parabacteroides sp. PH5-39]MDH6317003.1 dTDP-4-dehydrorhamnose reductase [Parabacteroides sp. PF5-13]MDH6320756.1 dTDP-4-dehydrorhamnose reductase [Parabacteroides sp. PH5-13]MDH6324542.1 dTDP-4-dehydrorhamnose reductase [Parabacteroides sp. PH5-8]MDH6328188.1 dTDP-4-dehydrorhamnose reductase [Parabacteroides sp. PH5-41]